MGQRSSRFSCVATREGGVDRNVDFPLLQRETIVATREGGVDRNTFRSAGGSSNSTVATREGGVDRNAYLHTEDDLLKSRHPRGWRG